MDKNIKKLLLGILLVNTGLFGVTIGVLGNSDEFFFSGMGIALIGYGIFLRYFFKK